MFGLGPTELIVILVLALVLLGPKKLPDVASGLGKAIRSFRKATRDLTDQLDIEDEVKNPFRELKAALRDEPPPYVAPAYVAPPAPLAPPAIEAAAVVTEPVPAMVSPTPPTEPAAPSVEVAAAPANPAAPTTKAS